MSDEIKFKPGELVTTSATWAEHFAGNVYSSVTNQIFIILSSCDSNKSASGTRYSTISCQPYPKPDMLTYGINQNFIKALT